MPTVTTMYMVNEIEHRVRNNIPLEPSQAEIFSRYPAGYNWGQIKSSLEESIRNAVQGPDKNTPTETEEPPV